MATNIMDVGNIARATYDPTTQASKILPVGGSLVPDHYDNLTLTYVASGNGAGQIATVGYQVGATLICTLTLSYDASNRITAVVRS